MRHLLPFADVLRTEDAFCRCVKLTYSSPRECLTSLIMAKNDLPFVDRCMQSLIGHALHVQSHSR